MRSISMAAMIAAAVVTAGVPILAVLMVMVVTVNIGIVAQTSVEQCAHRRISVPADTAVELDARFGQCCLRTAADASANQSVHAVLHQEACQCAVTAAVGINNFRMSDFAVRSFIKLELFGVAEMLKNLTVFIFYADLEPVRGSEQGGVRPVLIIQNDIGNRHSPTVIVAAITSRIKHHRLPTHVNLNGRQCGLHNESTIMLEQLRTLDKQRLLGYAGTVGKGKMQEVNTALEISIGIKDLLLDNKRKRGSNYGKSEHREEKHQADSDDH